MIASFFADLNLKKIRYCHWKSNSHLDRSFKGKTDFDLLVDPNQLNEFETISEAFGLKKRYSSIDKVYPSVHDFIAFDKEKGKLFHLHVHTKLIFGQKYYKDYRLPLEKKILDTSINLKEHYDIKVISPEYELVILMMRIILKSRYDLYASVKFAKRKPILPPNIIEEIKYLKQRLSMDKLKELIENEFVEFKDIFIDLRQYYESPYLYLRIYCLKRRFIKRSRSSLLLCKQSINNKQLAKSRNIAKKVSFSTGSKGGFAMAIVGVDGSGKSTNTKAISSWLSWKYSSKRVYLGISKSHFPYKVLSLLIYACQVARISAASDYFTNLRWYYIAKKRYSNYQYGLQMAELGYFIVFDRYPVVHLDATKEPMDGPRIKKEGSLKKKEESLYRKFNRYDGMIYLKTGYETILTRKPDDFKSDNAKKRIQIKINQLEAAVPAESSKEFFITNTEVGKTETLIKLKQIFWNYI